MIRSVIKRDGRRSKFDRSKIANAISAAFKASKTDFDLDLISDLTEKVCKKFSTREVFDLHVELIQDTVEKTLFDADYKAVAQIFNNYRQQRAEARECSSQLTKIFKLLVNNDQEANEIRKENANINSDSTMGTMLKFGSESSKSFSMRQLINPKFVMMHRSGDFHIHDLDFYPLTINCCQIDLAKLFKDGFSTGHGSIREPQTIQSAAALTCIAIQSNQNDMFGGQSIPCFEYYLAPYVVKSFIKRFIETYSDFFEVINGEAPSNLIDAIRESCNRLYHLNGTLLSVNVLEALANDLMIFMKMSYDKIQRAIEIAYQRTERDCYQAMESLLFNLNTMQSRAGAQTPFSSINYGTGTTPEQRMIIKNILFATDAGLGNSETPIFPVQVFKVKSGVNTTLYDPNYDLFKLACSVSAKRMFPNFSFIDAPYNLQYYEPNKPETEVAVMGCRTRVFGNVHDKNNSIIPSRGNLFFNTINLPRIALQSNGDIEVFYDKLKEIVEAACDQLEERFKYISKRHVYNYPFLMEQGVWLDSEKLDPDDTIGEVIKHGSLSVGFVGLAEALVALIGEHHGQSQEAQTFGLEVVSFMRDLLDYKSEKTKLNWTLFASPAESTAGRLLKLDRERFGVVPNVTDRDYYTNSFHIPVYFDIPAFKKIQIEAPYHALCNAGAITYVELDGDLTKNVQSVEKIVMFMRDCGIGYGAINHPIDRCPICGFVGVIHSTCPKCGRTDRRGVAVDKLKSLGVKLTCC